MKDFKNKILIYFIYKYFKKNYKYNKNQFIKLQKY